jgi:hypothetical protein
MSIRFSAGGFRNDPVPDVADMRKQAAEIRAEVDRIDKEIAHKQATDPYNWETMKAAAEWRLNRATRMSKLRSLDRDVQWNSPVDEWKPTPNGWWHGSDG